MSAVSNKIPFQIERRCGKDKGETDLRIKLLTYRRKLVTSYVEGVFPGRTTCRWLSKLQIYKDDNFEGTEKPVIWQSGKVTPLVTTLYPSSTKKKLTVTVTVKCNKQRHQCSEDSRIYTPMCLQWNLLSVSQNRDCVRERSIISAPHHPRVYTRERHYTSTVYTRYTTAEMQEICVQAISRSAPEGRQKKKTATPERLATLYLAMSSCERRPVVK